MEAIRSKWSSMSIILCAAINCVCSSIELSVAHSTLVTVHGFKGSEVHGSILVHGVHLGYIFVRKASASSSLIQNFKLNWQLLGKMSIFDDDFGSSIPSLSLTLNVEPWTCERLRTLFIIGVMGLKDFLAFQNYCFQYSPEKNRDLRQYSNTPAQIAVIISKN